jgi:alpha-L-arabinofuranosidase
MKEVDPSIEVCTGWGRPEFVEAMGSRPYDCLGTHSYSTPPRDGTLTPYGNLQVAAANRDGNLRNLRNRMAHYFPSAADRPELLVTECGTLNTPEPAYEARLSHVLYLAAQVAGQLENDVRVSINSNTANIPLADGSPDPGQLFGSPPDFLMTGRAWMLRLYATTAGGHVVTTSVTGNPTLTAPPGPTPPCGSCPAAPDVSPGPWSSTGCGQLRARGSGLGGPADHRAGSGLDLNGESVESYNTPADPDEISLHTVQARADHGVVRHDFEPHSVTLLKFAGRGHSCTS